jgi:hypothetical protein
MNRILKTLVIPAVVLLLCSGSATAIAQGTVDADNAFSSLSETLIISTQGTVWAKNKHARITLTKGSLIVIVGVHPVSVKTAAGEVSIPVGLAAMVQQELNTPVHVIMIGVRGKLADQDRDTWNITLNSADNLVYKLHFGDELVAAPDGNSFDITVTQHPPAVRKVIREAAHQLNSIALALNVNGETLAEKIATENTAALLTISKGSAVQLAQPVEISVEEGKQFVALQPDSGFTAADGQLVAAKKQ